MAHAKHAEVRERYGFRCGYCGVSETDSVGELTVDHYEPVSNGGMEDDENLVYACFRCNLHKSDTTPYIVNADGEIVKRILHPLRDALHEHIGENDDGTLFGITGTGESHIEILELNRAPLVAWRRTKPYIAALQSNTSGSEIAELNKVIASQEEYIRTLEALVRYYRSEAEP